jgi:hypothetical protein
MRTPKLYTFKDTKEATLIVDSSNRGVLKSIACSQKHDMMTKVNFTHIHSGLTYYIVKIEDVVWQDFIYNIDDIVVEPGDILKVFADSPTNIIITL